MQMAQKKESFFWTSYADLMTSLFFVMLVLFVLVIVLLNKKMENTQIELEKTKIEREATKEQLDEIKNIIQSTKDLDTNSFLYRPDYKKYVLRVQTQFPRGKYKIDDMIAHDKNVLKRELKNAAVIIKEFLKKNKNNQYLVIIEGQASNDGYKYNYPLSYQRALSLMRFWVEDAKTFFGKNCEVLICGSGDGTLKTNSIREKKQRGNQRFLIHILPKNIIEDSQPMAMETEQQDEGYTDLP